ncbi:MerR family transcriptional regulator [Subtercola endophyticus]|uniref:MerR family transcriptional regulator n=1 Tax=Subtercola endophyticus TaxID=2895559 RepID=UPI001E34766E|nr:MerR family transcriptional regulator [Subtercola endophyticus]UFS58047.1 MerR family transcriptional regulator [Subtercola endophyticus]
MTSRTTERAPGRFTIQEVSRRTGVSEPTLRYYEKIGLLGPIERDESSRHRRYTTRTVETIESLGCLRSAGMRVEDMRHYLRLLERGDDAAVEQRELFATHAHRLSDEIAGLQLRLIYLQRKADMWDARDRGDADAEFQATRDVIQAAEQISTQAKGTP